MSKRVLVLLALSTSLLLLPSGCAKKPGDTAAPSESAAGSSGEPSAVFTDARDGKNYKTVTIGGVTWMAENLNYQTESGSWCYENSADSCNKYGRLYDWNTAKTICPNGWRLPSQQEWDDLATAVGGQEIAGKKLKSKSGWNENGNGTDEFGFSALSGGYRGSLGNFDNAGNVGGWWTATGDDGGGAYNRNMNYDGDGVGGDYNFKVYGFSVRCLMGAPPEKSEQDPVYSDAEQFTDGRDGQKYKTVKIGTQTWMAENLNYQTKSGSWCYENSADSCSKYGRLYDWKTAKTVCPAGWKLPDTADWRKLVTTAGGPETAGKKLKSKSGWKWNNDDNVSGNGTDDYGFAAMPGSYRYRNSDGIFGDAGRDGNWWTATEIDGSDACRRFMSYHDDYVDEDGNTEDNKNDGYSVRCVKE